MRAERKIKTGIGELTTTTVLPVHSSSVRTEAIARLKNFRRCYYWDPLGNGVTDYLLLSERRRHPSYEPLRFKLGVGSYALRRSSTRGNFAFIAVSERQHQ